MAGNNDRDVLVLEWVRKAEHDLTNAENTFLMDDDTCPFDTVCFHAQQCAEKYLKAFLTFRGIPSAKSHDLNLLLRKLDDRELKEEIGDISGLIPYATNVRYPGIGEDETREQAEEAIALAHIVRQSVRKRLKTVL